MAEKPKGKKQKKSLTLMLEAVSVDHVNVTAVAQEDGDAEFHDTVKVLSTVDDAQLQAFFKSLGISKPAFFKNAPDEIPKIELNAKYEEHTVRLLDADVEDGEEPEMFAAMSDATVYDISIERLGSSTYQVVFKFKGIPREFHSSFEEAWLDGLRGVSYALSVVPPVKGANEEMPLNEQQEEEQEEENKGGESVEA